MASDVDKKAENFFSGEIFGIPKSTVAGVTVLTILYPILGIFVKYIPNPMVPGAIVALNIVCPVLAGHFYGVKSGAVAGLLGTLIAALFFNSSFDYYAAVPHAIMGGAAGYLGRYPMELYSPFAVIIGHILNIIVFTVSGLMTIDASQVDVIALGISTETVIDMVVVAGVIILFRGMLYQYNRW